MNLMKGHFKIILKLFSLLKDTLKVRGFSTKYDRIQSKKLKIRLNWSDFLFYDFFFVSGLNPESFMVSSPLQSRTKTLSYTLCRVGS